jgi:C4-dicarboxylate transporter, DctM subunit
MTAGAAGILLLVSMVLVLGAGVWISVGLFAIGILGLLIQGGMPVERQLAISVWNTATGEGLLSLPLFILMAEILFRTELSASLFKGLVPWTTYLPGKLLHVNVLGCTLFAACSGSAAATAATVGRITVSELFSRGYNRDMVMGSLAGAGTLGLMIPPSITMIVYGVVAETSILKLFVAGIVPGLLLAASYMAYIGIRSTLTPSLVPVQDLVFSWRDRIESLRHLGPVVGLVIMVIGSMYAGVASPTEAAAVGVLGALVISGFQRTLTWPNITQACLAALRTSSMLGLIICAAVFLSQAMAFLGLPRLAASYIMSWNLSPFQLIGVLLAFYLLLGCVLEGLSVIVMTLPITLPLVLQAGFDKIWFGVFLVLVVEMAQITPPVGFNLFVIQNLTGEKLGRVAIAAMPFCLIMVSFTFLITIFPSIATFLSGRAGP